MRLVQLWLSLKGRLINDFIQIEPVQLYDTSFYEDTNYSFPVKQKHCGLACIRERFHEEQERVTGDIRIDVPRASRNPDRLHEAWRSLPPFTWLPLVLELLP